MNQTNQVPIAFQTMLTRMEQYSRDPSAIKREILAATEEASNNKLMIVDATNPFVFLLSNAVALHVGQLNEMDAVLRKQYPRLATSDEEVYHHMSDNEFLDRFAAPVTCTFIFVIDYDDLQGTLVYDPVEKLYKLVIPRDTEITVSDTQFTLLYPIVIRKFNTGEIEISYDGAIDSPVEALSTTKILYSKRTDAQGKDWITFEAPVKQFGIESKQYPVEKSSNFRQEIPFKDQFYLARAFMRNNSTDGWVEIKATHSDQVFDVNAPTVLLKVFSDYLQATIPTSYILNDLVSGDIRIDVYTTKGEMSMDMSVFLPAAYSLRFNAVDEERDFPEAAAAMKNLACFVYSQEYLSGGSNGIDFETLRTRTIMNSNGDRQIPISEVGIQSKISDAGFTLVTNVDQLTDMIMLAARKLPLPSNAALNTPASIGINTLATDLLRLKNHSNVRDNNNRLTLMSNNLFLNENGILRLLGTDEVLTLNQLPETVRLATINANQYLYNPFSYVLDSSSDEFSLRAYNLDYPVMKDLSFDIRNETLSLIVNTATYQIQKTNSGYQVVIITRSGDYYKGLEDGEVAVQLAFKPVNETSYAYINGTLIGKNAAGERIFQFDLLSSFDIDSDQCLYLTNPEMYGAVAGPTKINLTHELLIIHTTNAITTNYRPIEANSYVGKFLLPSGSVLNSLERIQVTFGDYLKNLWSRSRNLVSTTTYQTYTHDIPALYEADVYEVDPITNSIYRVVNGVIQEPVILHHQGDPVLDTDGNPTYAHRAGDVVLDGLGEPLPVVNLTDEKEVDLLLVDGKYHFVTASDLTSYRNEIVAVLVSWIMDEIVTFQKQALQKTNIYFYPKTTLGRVKVQVDATTEDFLEAEQSFTVDLYVTKATFDNTSLREKLKAQAIKIIDSHISNDVVNMSSIDESLRQQFDETVLSRRVVGLGGDKNYQMVAVMKDHNRLCLKKNLVLRSDGTLRIEEDITVNFHNAEKTF